jgi:hypothetical protein
MANTLVLDTAVQRLIETATVTVRKGDGKGRGVLVSGQLILTAAHCVTYDLEGSMVLGDYFLQEIETSHGVLLVTPLAVEPVFDIAVLGALDGQEFPDDVEAFEAWCETVTPVAVCRDTLPLAHPSPVALYTHTNSWITGTATVPRDEAPSIWLEMAEATERGTSGSPIVTASGAIVGIASNMGGDGTVGRAPRPHLALPVWVVRRIQSSEEGESC